MIGTAPVGACPLCDALLPIASRTIPQHDLAAGGILGGGVCPESGKGWREAYTVRIRDAGTIADHDTAKAQQSRTNADRLRRRAAAIAGALP